ncbi:hypothetical protein ABZP36_027882 [Zizania latifolia]
MNSRSICAPRIMCRAASFVPADPSRCVCRSSGGDRGAGQSIGYLTRRTRGNCRDTQKARLRLRLRTTPRGERARAGAMPLPDGARDGVAREERAEEEAGAVEEQHHAAAAPHQQKLQHASLLAAELDHRRLLLAALLGC